MWAKAELTWIFATVGLLLGQEADGVHYTCASDEVTGEMQGETGVVCGPRCIDVSFDCPTDVPAGTTAQPQCMLQDVTQTQYCGLLCQVDTQCPSGSACRRVGTDGQQVGLCVHSLSFSEWAKQGTRRKLSIGFPAMAGQSAHGFRIAKAYAALQSLKKRYGMQDGDADVLVVKELLSSATAGMPSKSGTSMFGSSMSGSSMSSVPSVSLVANPNTVAAESSSWIAPFKNDIDQFTGYLKDGIPGLEREAHDITWNIEHLTQRGKAEQLLRGLLMILSVYLVGGAAYKYHMMGARGQDTIPHVDFWIEYPMLVLDGVRYSKILAFGLVGKSPDGETGGFNQFGDRDSFANFEPSR